MKRFFITVLAAAAASLQCFAQAPPLNPAAIAGSKEDEAAVERGAEMFGKRCASCHGPAARGNATAPDLIRSVPVRNDKKGELISPILRNSFHAKSIRAPALTDPQVTDLVAWLHAMIYAAANRSTYEFLEVLGGDAAKGEAYFRTNCAACHSVTGDLKGVGAKYDPPVLQSIWMSPPRRRGAAAAKTARTVTVTAPGKAAVTGTLDYIDEFNVTLREASGATRSFVIENDVPRVEIHDPLQPHYDLYRKLTDADIHNVTAYLATIQ